MRCAVVVGLAVGWVLWSGLTAASVAAGNIYWNHPDGNWTEWQKWNPQQVPTSIDDAFIQNGGAVEISAGTAYADDLYISSGSTLQLSGGSLNMSNSGSRQYIGHAGGTTGILNQSGGGNSVGYHMYIGYGTGATGIYSMTGGSLYVDNVMYVGDGQNATGRFEQSAGTVLVYQRLQLGNSSGASGTYRLSGSGTLTVNGSQGIEVGLDDGYGRFEWFRSGGITADRIKMGSLGTLAMGYNFSSIPALVQDLNLATLEVTNGATVTKTNDGVTSQVRYLRIGSGAGAGYGNQTGGTVEVGQSMYVGDGSGAVGSATQSGGTLSTTVHLYVGMNGGTGAYHLQGGTLNVGSNLFVGDGSTGTMTVRGGTLNVQNIFMPNTTGTGTLIIDGGTLNNTGNTFKVTNLTLGNEAGRTGAYTLAGSKTLTATDLRLGVNGTGNFTQSAGTANLVNLRFAAEAGSGGTYLLTGGALNVSGQVFDGVGQGILQIDGGTFAPGGTVTVAQLKVGTVAAANHTHGTHTYNVGLLTLGNSTYRLTGGTLAVGGVGKTGTGSTLNIDGGTFQTTGAVAVDGLGIGIETTGSHHQADHTYTVGTLTLGGGAYTLSGGTLAVANVANSPAGTGTLALNGGGFSATGNVAADHLVVGVNTAASYAQTGGVWQVGSLLFGAQAGGGGALALAGGTLQVSDGIQTGTGTGTLTIIGGTLALGGGADLTVTDLKVGDGATGAHTQTAGDFRTANNLLVGANSGHGTYRLEQTGQLVVGNQVRIADSGGTGRFEWYREGGITAANGMVVGPGGILAMGHDFDANRIAGAGGLVSGMDAAILEVTRGGKATQAEGTVALGSLRLGSNDGSGSYRLEGDGILQMAPGSGTVSIGSGSGQAGRFEWYREGGFTAPRVGLAAAGTLAMGHDFDVGTLLGGGLYAGDPLAGVHLATLEITAGAIATQADGDATLGTLRIGAADGAGTYRLEGGTLNASSLHLGAGGAGTIELAGTANLNVSSLLLFGSDSTLAAEPGSQITLTGTSVHIHSITPDSLDDMRNLTLAFQPEMMVGPPSLLEVAGEDRGRTMAGFAANFALDTLIVGHPDGSRHTQLQLLDLFDNQTNFQPEALYVHNIVVYDNAILDLNQLSVYYSGTLFVADSGAILNGMPQYIPEPVAAWWLIVGAMACIRRRRSTS